MKEHVSEGAAMQAVGPYAFRDKKVITQLLEGAGFSKVDVSKIVVERHFSPARAAIRAEMLSSPYERELAEKGEETIAVVVDDIDAVLEPHRVGEGLIVPQDTHLFQMIN